MLPGKGFLPIFPEVPFDRCVPALRGARHRGSPTDTCPAPIRICRHLPVLLLGLGGPVGLRACCLPPDPGSLGTGVRVGRSRVHHHGCQPTALRKHLGRCYPLTWGRRAVAPLLCNRGCEITFVRLILPPLFTRGNSDSHQESPCPSGKSLSLGVRVSCRLWPQITVILCPWFAQQRKLGI